MQMGKKKFPSFFDKKMGFRREKLSALHAEEEAEALYVSAAWQSRPTGRARILWIQGVILMLKSLLHSSASQLNKFRYSAL